MLDTYTPDVCDYIGIELGGYQVLRPLGQGGDALVFLARNEETGAYAAVKVPNSSRKRGTLNGLGVEARVLTRLNHPHILQLYDYNLNDPAPYLALQYARYGTLQRYIDAGKPLTPHQLLSYVRQAAYALDYMHRRGLIHRDVKPGNLLLLRPGYLVLGDFGITSPTMHTEKHVIGTPLYMAPEQFLGKSCPASDQYALAVVVYELLYGQAPFHGSVNDIADGHLYKRLPFDNTGRVPYAVEWVLQKALAKSPRDRFNSVRAFAFALERAMLERRAAPVLPARQSTIVYPSMATPLPLILERRPVQVQRKGKAQKKRSHRNSVSKRMLYYLLALVSAVLFFAFATQLQGMLALGAGGVSFILLTFFISYLLFEK